MRCPEILGGRIRGVPEPFKPSPCHQLGICVCTEFPDVVHQLDNLQAYLRRTCWRRKGVSSKARHLLDQHLLVLEFSQASRSQQALPSLDAAGDQIVDEWDSLMEGQSASAEQTEQTLHPGPIYVHVGWVNRSTWKFSALRCLQAVPEPPPDHPWPPELVHLAPMSAEAAAERLACYTSAEIMAHLLHPARAWSVTCREISMVPDHWTLLHDGTFPVIKLEDVEQHCFWLGSENEQNSRREKNRKRKRSTPAGPRSGTRARGKKHLGRSQNQRQAGQIFYDGNDGDEISDAEEEQDRPSEASLDAGTDGGEVGECSEEEDLEDDPVA